MIQQERRLREILPDGGVHLSGSASVPHNRLAWELLSDRPDLLQEYRELKATPDDYERRKRELFERVVAQL